MFIRSVFPVLPKTYILLMVLVKQGISGTYYYTHSNQPVVSVNNCSKEKVDGLVGLLKFIV